MIDSVRPYVGEVVVVDTGSTDKTVQLCKDIGARVYQVGFTDFASIRTLTSHLARSKWVLMLDADETLSNPEMLDDIVSNGSMDAYAFPRKRWLDLHMTQQTEIEAYPDYQVRFYKNNPNHVWKRELHEFFHGAAVHQCKDGPIINHFHDVFKSSIRLKERDRLYTKLAQKARVTVEGGRPVTGKITT
jgi:glycosyltransferase involved in cell wall biosynthesis